MYDDSWVYDSFTIVDHDYSYEPYRRLIQKKGLSILGPYIQEGEQEWTNADTDEGNLECPGDEGHDGDQMELRECDDDEEDVGVWYDDYDYNEVSWE